MNSDRSSNPLAQICSCRWHDGLREPGIDCPVHPRPTAGKDRFRKVESNTPWRLLPCRLCGSPAELWQRWRRDDVWDSFGACTNLEDVDGEACLFHLPDDPHFYRDRKADAVRHWNLIMGPRGAVEAQPATSNEQLTVEQLQTILSSEQLTPSEKLLAKQCLSLLDQILRTPDETTSDVQALLTVQQENKRLRGALARISAGTPDLLPPYRADGASQLRDIAIKALQQSSPLEPREPSGDLQYDRDYTAAELAALCRAKDRHIARLESAQHSPVVPRETTTAPLCDGEVRVIYEHGEPKGVRDTTGYLCFLSRVNKYDGQEDRYRNELALRARQAEVIAAALRGAVEPSGEPTVERNYFINSRYQPGDPRRYEVRERHPEKSGGEPDWKAMAPYVAIYPDQGMPKAGDICLHCKNVWLPSPNGSGIWHNCHTGAATPEKPEAVRAARIGARIPYDIGLRDDGSHGECGTNPPSEKASGVVTDACGCSRYADGSKLWCGKHWAERDSEKSPGDPK